MRIFKPVPGVIFILPLLLLQCCKNPSQHPSEKEPGSEKDKPNTGITVETFKIAAGEGWGYNIILNGRIHIHQETIPVLEGNRLFHTREDALKVGTMVKEKLMNNQPPGITKQEISQLLGIKE